MDEHTITIDAAFRNWLTGTADGLPYAVKVCDVNSDCGIDNGRIIKLFLLTADGKREIATYERGWVKYPSRKYEDSMNALIDHCATLPKADEPTFQGL